MFTFNEMPSLSSLFSTFASIAASIMLFRSMVYQILPQEVSDYLLSLLQNLFKAHYVPTLTFVFDEGNEFIGRNQIFEAACVYLDTLHSPETKRLNVRQSAKEKGLIIRLENGEKVTDFYDGIELYWKFVCSEQGNSSSGNRYHSHSSEKRFFELSFHNKHREKVSKLYLPFIVGKAKAISDENRFLKMFTLSDSFDPGLRWESTNLKHPATFETLAMDQDKKTDIIEDLNRFVKRKEFYKKVGRAWKRGYLLYGPPGTGKSSLVAAMANHLKFDIYDLQLANIKRDTVLRRLLLATANRSILVIEDIDCSVCLPDRLHGEKEKESGHQNNKNSAGTSLTLSGLLNFIDGLWSSCGDERIIIFTTNHKDRLDPALLRPGRMDKHIHMGYCTYEAFKQLASRYLGITSDHQLYGEIKGLLDEAKVTPAQVAEGFLKYENDDFALEEFLKLLKGKKMEGHDDEYCEGKTDENENDNIVLLDLRDPKGTK